MSDAGGRFGDQLFVTATGEPTLAHCAVLFLDLLGVRAMNRSPDVDQHLIALERAVTRTYRDFLKPDSPWPAAFFSDTLVLASPVIPGQRDEESALGDLIIQGGWLQLSLIAEGFFVRGGLSLGRVHMHEGLVFGPALVEAYELEGDSAVSPRIILSREAEESQRQALAFYARPEHSPENAMLMRDRDGHTFIHYLALLFEDPTDPLPPLVAHRDAVTERLREFSTDKKLWEKYRWVGEYHNAVIERHLPAEQDLLVKQDDLTWRFESFA